MNFIGERIIGKCHNETHCFHKGEEISESIFRYKGCWTCSDFERGEYFPYYNVKEASKLLNVSTSTIRRWIENNKLKGILFTRESYEFKLGAWKMYFIQKESVRALLQDNQ